MNSVKSQGFTEIGSSLGLPTGYQNGEYGGGVSFVDFNQDGLDDLTFATGYFSLLKFYLNTGNGFEEIPPLINVTLEVKQIHWVDYDNDGDLDLYLTTRLGNQLHKNTGNLVFEEVTQNTGFIEPGGQSFCGVWLDYDEDGLLDLCISHRIGFLTGKITLYHNLGNDQFEDVTVSAGLDNLGYSVLAMTSFDMNNDGWEDIYVGQDFDMGNLLLKNKGDGTFENISESSNSNIQNNTMSTTIGDYNNDGWMDIYLTNTMEGNTFLENQGDETFEDKTLEMGVVINEFCWGALFFDADNDMDLDLHVSSTQESFMFENPGNEAPFNDVSDNWGFGADDNYSVGSAIGDYNEDGFVDFAENNSSESTHTLWQNDFTEHNFITIKLQGTISNSMAVGAVIDVSAGGIHQIRRIGCGEGFSSQNSYTQHFGLGTESIIDEISVKWPNGLVNTFQEVAVNQNLEIIEMTIPGAGCMDSLACNFDSLATSSDGSCYYGNLYYDCFGNCLNDIDMDGVCDELEVPGCMDTTSCNFNPLATDSDDSCVYSDPYYDCFGNCLNDLDQDGICDELEIVGCTAPTACNYNPQATDSDNALCIYPEPYYDCYGNCLFDTDQDGICDELEIPGCMDSLACNYTPEATDDDESCAFLEVYTIAGELNPTSFIQEPYTYLETTGSNYFWEVTGGEIISGQGSASVEVIWDMEGPGKLSVKETNSFGCEDSTFIDVNIIIVDTEDWNRHFIRIHPNPATNLLTIDLGDWFSKSVTIEIFDITGKSVLKQKKNASFINLEVQFLNNGLYQLVVTNGTEKIRKKLIVHK